MTAYFKGFLHTQNQEKDTLWEILDAILDVMHYEWFPLFTNMKRFSVVGKQPESTNPVIEVDSELQQSSEEYSAMLVLNTQITSHKEAYHYTAAIRALATLTTLSLLGSPDQTFCKEIETQSKSWFIFTNLVTFTGQDLSRFRGRLHTTYDKMKNGKNSDVH